MKKVQDKFVPVSIKTAEDRITTSGWVHRGWICSYLNIKFWEEQRVPPHQAGRLTTSQARGIPGRHYHGHFVNIFMRAEENQIFGRQTGCSAEGKGILVNLLVERGWEKRHQPPDDSGTGPRVGIFWDIWGEKNHHLREETQDLVSEAVGRQPAGR